MKSKRSLPFISLLAALVILVLAAGAGLWLWSLVPAVPKNASHGKALIGGPFQLVDQDGKTVTDAKFMGKFRLMYFGYTFCPDVCPLDLQHLSQALKLLEEESPAKAIQVQPIFITVDPERDTQTVMKNYIALFHPRLIGLTGSPEQIEAVKKAFHVYSAKRQDPGSTDYLVDHSALIYLMDPQGQYITHFGNGTKPEEIAKGLAEAIK